MMRDLSCQLDPVESARLRPPAEVMRLSRMGSFFPTRLSFMRVLLRSLSAGEAKISRAVWEMDKNGWGRAVYRLDYNGAVYSLVAFSNQLADSARTDRVIATAWDAAFVLYDGVPDRAELDRLQAAAPHQEKSRYGPRDLVLSRANKSVRLFEELVSALAEGRQPEAGLIARTGYLMRTTAVYGNGKFGICDREQFAGDSSAGDHSAGDQTAGDQTAGDPSAGRDGFARPFAAEMLAVYLIRHFTHDLVDHIAAARGGKKAIRLDRELRRHLGIGNSTGLGMAPFLVTHPVLLNNWMLARETAWARVRGLAEASPEQQQRLQELASRAGGHLAEWQVPDEAAQTRIESLRAEWAALRASMSADLLSGPYPFAALAGLAADTSQECQELMLALCLEVNGEAIDGLADCMDSHLEARLNPAARAADLLAETRQQFGWALAVDFSQPDAIQHFWYVSAAKLEPRLGNRHLEAGSELESPLDIARRVQAMEAALAGWLETAPPDKLVAEFLLAFPQHRLAVQRVQTNGWAPYSEIQDNLLDASCLPVDMLRCKLSFFGASKFDPKSDRWTRITMYQGAPLADELADARLADDWWLPVLG